MGGERVVDAGCVIVGSGCVTVSSGHGADVSIRSTSGSTTREDTGGSMVGIMNFGSERTAQYIFQHSVCSVVTHLA